MDFVAGYQWTVVALGVTGMLLYLQMLVTDVASIRGSHPPGHPVAPDRGSFLFRAVRAQANTNESIAVFILFALSGILSAANPVWLGALAWLYVIARAMHMSFYYADLALLRSLSFGVGAVALLGMSVVVVLAWIC